MTMASFEHAILCALGSSTSPMRPVDIAKSVGLTTAKDVNKYLYGLQKQKLVDKGESSSPLWYITEEGKHQMQGSEAKGDQTVPTSNGTGTIEKRRHGSGDTSRQRHGSGETRPLSKQVPGEKEMSGGETRNRQSSGDSIRKKHASGDSSTRPRSRHGSGQKEQKFPHQVSDQMGRSSPVPQKKNLLGQLPVERKGVSCTNPQTSSADLGIDIRILEVSQVRTKSSDIARLLGTSKKALNPKLYQLEKQNVLEKVGDSPPEWKTTALGQQIFEESTSGSSQSSTESSNTDSTSTSSSISHWDHRGSRFKQEYAQIERLGKGGYGSVMKAKHRIDRKSYAVKEIPKCKLFKIGNLFTPEKNVVREVRLLSGLNHERIVRYFFSWVETLHNESENTNTGDSSAIESSFELPRPFFTANDESDGITFADPKEDDEKIQDTNDKESSCTDDSSDDDNENEGEEKESYCGILYLQMELCEKQTLKDLIAKGMSKMQTSKIFNEIVEGLAYIHSKGIIHRDLKPVNIFLDKDEHIKIGDFGLATSWADASSTPNDENDSIEDRASSNLTTNIGTPTYIAPEITSPGYTEKVDMYSLGIILFEMSYKPMGTGMERFVVIQNLKKKSIVFPNDFPAENGKECDLITKMLDHDPDKRPSCAELVCQGVLKRQSAGVLPFDFNNFPIQASSSNDDIPLVPKESHSI